MGVKCPKRINENSNTSAFNQLESLDNINILMGSRAFYEGWDSTRPNIILYINIGSSLESKKFVLQSIGRGVRIAPLPSQRRRFKFIQSDLQKDSPLLKINEIIYSPLETLFVMGTNSKVLAEVITTLKIEDSMNEVVSRQITKLGNTKVLFIPTYPDDSFIMITDQTSTRMRISKSDLEYAKSVFSGLDERIILCKYNISPNLLNIIKKSLDPTNFQTYYEYRKEDSHPDLIIQKIITHFNIYLKNQNKTKKQGEEFIRFLNIETILNDMREYRNILEKIDEIINNELDSNEDLNTSDKGISIKKIQSNYYVPLILTENESINYIQRRISAES